MSLREFAASVNRGRFGEKDRKWFSAWLKKYAGFMRHGDGSAIPLSKDSTVKFCVMLKGNQLISCDSSRQGGLKIAHRFNGGLRTQASESPVRDERHLSSLTGLSKSGRLQTHR